MRFERDRHVNHWHNWLLGIDWKFILALAAFATLVRIVMCHD